MILTQAQERELREKALILVINSQYRELPTAKFQDKVNSVYSYLKNGKWNE